MLSRTQYFARHSLRAFSTTRAALQTYHNANAQVRYLTLCASQVADNERLLRIYIVPHGR